MNEIHNLANPKDVPAPRWFHIAVATSMVLSAVAALIGSLHTSRTMSALVEQNARLVRANSTPVLEFGHGNQGADGVANLQFRIRNVGSGLARVVWFELLVDGKPMAHMDQAVRQISPELVTPPYLTTSPVAGRVFAPGTDALVMTWKRPPATNVAESKAWEAMNHARFKRITVATCFCSVFQECWVSKLDGDFPKPSPDCVNEKKTSLRG
jgi:hypothetical protein